MSDVSLRLDKWLWYARFFKSRTLAAAICNRGKVRCCGEIVGKAHHKVCVGDVLTFAQGRHIRVVRVAALATRRGPAAEAQALYDDLRPPSARSRLPVADSRPMGSGRPTKRDRRALARLRGEV